MKSPFDFGAILSGIRMGISDIGGSKGSDEEVRVAFESCDSDNNGQIDRQELASALEKLGITQSKEKVDILFAVYDTDKNGTIDYDEFKEFLTKTGLSM